MAPSEQKELLLKVLRANYNNKVYRSQSRAGDAPNPVSFAGTFTMYFGPIKDLPQRMQDKIIEKLIKVSDPTMFKSNLKELQETDECLLKLGIRHNMTETEATEILQGGPYKVGQENTIVWPYRFLKLCFEAMTTTLSETESEALENYSWVRPEQITPEMTTLPIGKRNADIIFLKNGDRHNLVYFDINDNPNAAGLIEMTKKDMTKDIKKILLEHMCYFKVSDAFDESRKLLEKKIPAFGDAVMTMVESTLVNIKGENPKLRFDQRAVRVLRKIQAMKLEENKVIPRLLYTDTAFRYKFSALGVLDEFNDAPSALNEAEITIPYYTEILSDAFEQIQTMPTQSENAARQYVVRINGEDGHRPEVSVTNEEDADEPIDKEKFATVIIEGKKCDLIFSSPLNLQDFKLKSKDVERWTWNTQKKPDTEDIPQFLQFASYILTEAKTEGKLINIGEDEYACEISDTLALIFEQELRGDETLLSFKIVENNKQWKQTNEGCIYKKLTVGKIKDWTTIERNKGGELIQEGPFHFTIRDRENKPLQWVHAHFMVDNTYTFRQVQSEKMTNEQLQGKDLQNMKSMLENYANKLVSEQYECATALQITRDAMKNKRNNTATPIAAAAAPIAAAAAPIAAADTLTIVNAADVDDATPNPPEGDFLAELMELEKKEEEKDPFFQVSV